MKNNFLNKINAKKVLKYLVHNEFNMNYLPSKICQHLKDNQVLKEINLNLEDYYQIFKMDNLFLAKVGKITKIKKYNVIYNTVDSVIVNDLELYDANNKNYEIIARKVKIEKEPLFQAVGDLIVINGCPLKEVLKQKGINNDFVLKSDIIKLQNYIDEKDLNFDFVF